MMAQNIIQKLLETVESLKIPGSEVSLSKSKSKIHEKVMIGNEKKIGKIRKTIESEALCERVDSEWGKYPKFLSKIFRLSRIRIRKL